MDTHETNLHQLILIYDDDPEVEEHLEYVQTSFGIYDPLSEEG